MQRWDTKGVFPPFWPFYCNFGKIHWMRKIQMVDTKNQYLAIKEEVDQAIQNVLDTAAYINGKAVQDLRVFAHHKVRDQTDFFAGGRQVVESSHGHIDLVAHAVAVHQNLWWILF